MAYTDREDDFEQEFISEPLDRLSLEINKNGLAKTVPALHQGWVEPVQYMHYVPPPNIEDFAELTDELRVSQEAWIDRMSFIQDNITWILELPHHRFWSHLVYDRNVRQFLDSFLSYGPRYYDPPNPYLNEEMKKNLLNVFRDVFIVHLRMATYKESQLHHITPSVFGEIIYENFLFDIPKMMDLCALYADTNCALLQKLIENIFKHQPQYYDDLVHAVPSVLTALDNVQFNFGLETKSESDPCTANINGSPSSIKELSWSRFQDTIHFLVDITTTLSAFLDVYQPACVVFHDQNLALRIANFHDAVIPLVRRELMFRSNSNECHETTVENMKRKLHLARNCCVKIFRNVMVACYIQPILEVNEICEKQTELVDSFLDILTAVLSDPIFVSDYAKKYPLEDDLDIIAQTRINFDSVRVDYLLRGIELIQSKSHKAKKVPDDKSKKLPKNSIISDYNNEEEEFSSEGACASAPVNGIELESLISQVKDLLPALGEGFIEACLDYYNFKAENVIDVLLNDSLPPALRKLDENLLRKEKTKNSNPNGNDADIPTHTDYSNSILYERINVFDNDEFDVFTRDNVDMSRIHKGKRSDSKTTQQLLNDKTHVKETKRIYENYNNIIEEVDDIYNDEYDDTYDDNVVGAFEPDRQDDELLLRRAFTTPRVLSTEKKEKPLYQNNNDDEEEKEPEKFRDCFVANPEDIRRRNEERWQMKQQMQRSKKSIRVNKDVKGQARGQGQSDDVLRNREFKGRHKATRGNHNRRAMSDRKRSSGMIPS